MYLREAVTEDNVELQNLQSQCPMGTSLIVSIVNTPDFFARAKVHERHKVYVVCEAGRIIGSGAGAVHEAVVNGQLSSVGYEFQYFTSPNRRRQGVAVLLHQHIEDYFRTENVVLSFCTILEDNLSSVRFFETQGYKHHRSLVMPTLPIYKKFDVLSEEKIRSAKAEDLEGVADLLYRTWGSCNLYEPYTAKSLARFVGRTQAYGLEDILIFEDQREILACLSRWDYNRTRRLIVKELSPKLRTIALLADFIRLVRPMPQLPKPGINVTRWSLTHIGFKHPRYLTLLIKFVNNQALEKGADQLYFVCERNSMLLNAIQGLFHTNVDIHLYVKPFEKELSPDTPVSPATIDP